MRCDAETMAESTQVGRVQSARIVGRLGGPDRLRQRQEWTEHSSRVLIAVDADHEMDGSPTGETAQCGGEGCGRSAIVCTVQDNAHPAKRGVRLSRIHHRM